MSCATAITARTSHRLGSGELVVPGEPLMPGPLPRSRAKAGSGRLRNSPVSGRPPPRGADPASAEASAYLTS